jgi:hypothetical protein
MKKFTKIWIYSLALMGVLLMLSSSCKKKDDNNNPTPTPQVPVVTTDEVSNITQTTATSGGNVTSQGTTAVIGKGVCWSTSQSPTTADNHTSNGDGTGNFSSSITGLTENPTYYVRAYATNSVGTAYGNQVFFTPDVITFVVTSQPNGTDYFYIWAKCITDDILLTKVIIKDPFNISYTYTGNQQLWLKDEIVGFPDTYPKSSGTWFLTFYGNLSSDNSSFVSTASLNLAGK